MKLNHLVTSDSNYIIMSPAKGMLYFFFVFTLDASAAPYGLDATRFSCLNIYVSSTFHMMTYLLRVCPTGWGS